MTCLFFLYVKYSFMDELIPEILSFRTPYIVENHFVQKSQETPIPKLWSRLTRYYLTSSVLYRPIVSIENDYFRTILAVYLKTNLFFVDFVGLYFIQLRIGKTDFFACT